MSAINATLKKQNMEKIPMVDLHSQYLHMKDEIDEAIAGVIESSVFIKGATVTAFEEHLAQYLGVKHVIACGNGTDALQLSLMALDLKPGDEVITTPFTFVSTLEVVALLRLKPVLAD
ncbi:MAG: aminotransferase class I/II-fold pyridoxal phosphate-dependent enzyme, partial [Methanobacterium paludis]|nr:aminotransferase class I/II-fold pyridoxal phosphate-dependent enzyme [Methanobacterium paludis]